MGAAYFKMAAVIVFDCESKTVGFITNNISTTYNIFMLKSETKTFVSVTGAIKYIFLGLMFVRIVLL